QGAIRRITIENTPKAGKVIASWRDGAAPFVAYGFHLDCIPFVDFHGPRWNAGRGRVCSSFDTNACLLPERTLRTSVVPSSTPIPISRFGPAPERVAAVALRQSG